MKNNITCIICKKSSWEFLFTAKDRMFYLPGEFSEFRCASCGLIRLSPLLSGKALAKYYPSSEYYSYKSLRKTFFGILRSYLVSHKNNSTLLSRFIGLFLQVPAIPTQKKPGKILDIGCGSGETLSLLQDVGWDVYGMDIDANAIRSAKSRGLKNVSVGEFEHMKTYRDNSFDVIRLYHVIEHLGKPEKCLRLAYKKLKPGGELIVGTPNSASLLLNMMKSYWYNLDCPRHLFLFSPHTLRSLAKRAKFSSCSIEFRSAGGIVGSLQYVLHDYLGIRLDLINKPILIMMFYPLERIIDMTGYGDIIILSARK